MSRAARLRGDAVTLAYRLGWALIRTLPERLTRRLFQVGADLAWRRRGKGVRRLESNYRRVLGPDADEATLAATTRAGVRSYARYWLEVFRLPATPQEVHAARFHLAGEGRIREVLSAGRGVVLALPHMGNWDEGGAWMVGTGVRFTTVAERLEPAGLFDRFVAFRESLGMEVVPLTGGERPPFDILAERLRAGGLLCLLADRDLTSAGVPVTFFGATATMPAGPALLALRTGAPLMPVTLWFPEDGSPGGRGQVHPAIPDPGRSAGTVGQRVAAMTQQMADVFAEGIRAHPQDWHMLQRLWRDDLDPARRPQAEAAAPEREGAA